MNFSREGLYRPVIELPEVNDGDTAVINVPSELLPGEFVIRFDYRKSRSGESYPSEKFIFINDQDLELRVNPIYSNSPDSTWFQKGERENASFAEFSGENGRRKGILGLLQNFLLNYDDPASDFYQQAITEYEKRRREYNQWITNGIHKDSSLFVSRIYQFEYLPETNWQGNETDRIKSLIHNYFEYIDFSSSLIVRTIEMKKWMDGYVNLYGQLATTVPLRDSLFSEAGRSAIEKARKGNPAVYGWMVDYFYKGYESNGISSGMRMLEPYLDDPDCLTTKRKEINKRLEGMKTLVPGTLAPDIALKDSHGDPFDLYAYETSGEYILLLFWSAGCSHCFETIDQLYPWQQQDAIRERISVVAVGLDDTEGDINKWRNRILELPSWTNLLDPGGINGKVANDYFILSTPVMILMDAKSKKIMSMPETVTALIQQFNN